MARKNSRPNINDCMYKHVYSIFLFNFINFLLILIFLTFFYLLQLLLNVCNFNCNGSSYNNQIVLVTNVLM